MRFDRKHAFGLAKRARNPVPIEEPAPSAELAVSGSGPFHLPACQEDIHIFNDGEVAVVMFKTIRGQSVGVPIPSFALRNLGLALIGAASSPASPDRLSPS